MSAMDATRLELYELLKPKLEEEAARRLILALSPEPERVVTKDDILASEARMDARLARMEATLTRRMVAIMGAWTVLVGSAFAWAAAIFS